MTRHWSGKHRAVVWGINLQTLVWTDGAGAIPCDIRVYRSGGTTKNEQFREMLATAAERGFRPACVLFDSWYSSLENLKDVREHGWHFLTRLRANRLVNPDRAGHVGASEVEPGPAGRVVQLKGYGLVRLFPTVSRDGRAEYYAASRLETTEAERAELERQAWGIESYHRSLKQHGGAERSQARSAVAQANHLLLSVRAYLRLEVHRLRTGVSHFEAKCRVVRGAMRSFLENPMLAHLPTA